MKKSFLILVVLSLLAMLAVVPTFAQTAIVCESTPTVAAGDWLSKIAATAYGSPQAYFPIFSATNSQAIADKSFHFIDNPGELKVGWKLCIPAESVASAGLDLAALKNASYKSEYGKDGVAKLVNGKYSAPAELGTPLRNTVFLSNAIAYGNVGGTPSAVVALVENGGGSGVFTTLHLIQLRDGAVSDTAQVLLGDRINLTSLGIQDDKIVVGMTTQGPDEAMCCGTQRVLNTYALNGDKLDQATTQVVGNVEQAAPSATTAAGASGKLTGVVWKWTKSLYNDGKTVTPVDPNRYLVEFLADGTLSITADCNRVGGTYKTEGNHLTITLGPSTLVACPPDSQAPEFTQQLGEVASYLFNGDNLVLEFKLDSGSMTFAPSAPNGLAGSTWTVVNYNNGKEAVITPIVGTNISMDFGADGTVSGVSGCNNYSGKYETSGDALKVGPLASTRRACVTPDGVMEQETQYLAALQNSATYKIEGNTLTIRDASGAMQVVATRREPATLAGSSWTVTGINNGNEAVVSLIPGTEISLKFGTDGMLSGNTGCNSYNGSFEATTDTLKVGPVAATQRACIAPDGVMTQESQYLAALGNSATFDIAGNVLTIRDASGAMQVVATKAEPITLAGSSWKVVNVNNGNQAVVSLVQGTEITLDFGTDGRVSGSAGCNSYTGSYESTETTLKVGALAATLKLCTDPAGVMEQETQYLAALQKAATFDISGSTLTIRDTEGAMQVVASQ